MFTQYHDYDDKTKKRKKGFSHVLFSLKSKHWTDFKTPSTHAPTNIEEDKSTDAYPYPGLQPCADYVGTKRHIYRGRIQFKVLT